MKRFIFITTLTVILFFSFHQVSKAQSAELIGGNMLNGAITGAALGAATMGLQNTNDFAPLRVGVGAGIIGGMGIAVYDIVKVPKGQQFYISGIFNDGTNSSVIILLDTFYGAIAGAALGSAITLIGNQSVLEGLQYGTSAGAWAGFGLGLIDSFLLSERNSDFISKRLSNRSSFFQIDGADQSLSIIQPDVYPFMKISENSLSVEWTPGVNLFTYQKTF